LAAIQFTYYLMYGAPHNRDGIWNCFASFPGLADIAAGGPVDHDSPESDIDILAALGRNLKAARLSAGLTQREVAARAGIALSIVARIESGCGDPCLKLLGDLAHAVGCDAHELVNL
jgi:DNA-binding XRE family transcriptional regulator